MQCFHAVIINHTQIRNDVVSIDPQSIMNAQALLEAATSIIKSTDQDMLERSKRVAGKHVYHLLLIVNLHV